ncbi:N-methyl-L-tryptophan oxidase, partial [Mycetocola reblochoni]
PTRPRRGGVDADVIVVGLGAMGAATAWRLAERGVSVIGVDQFAPPHPLGSTHGLTRLFRVACLEHPALAGYALAARELFRELEARTGRRILTETGGVFVGAPDSQVVAGSREAARAAGIDVEVIDADELRRRYPQQAGVLDTDVAVLDPNAGVADPEQYLSAALEAATAAGARLVTGTRVRSVDVDKDGVTVTTGAGRLRARQAVVTAGAWLDTLVPSLPLDPIRSPLTWFAPRQGEGFGIADYPVFIRQLPDSTIVWSHGAREGEDVKVGLGDIGVDHPRIRADELDRGVSPAETAELSAVVSRVLPGLDPTPSRVQPCMITRTPDGQFLLGRVGPRLVVGGGDSGHAFKHAPAIGEVLARAVLDEEQVLRTDFVDPLRFGAP